MSSYCTNCGAPLGPGSAFCTSCGTPTQALEAQPPAAPSYGYPPSPYAPPPPSQGINPRVLLLGLGGVGVLALITVLLVLLLGGRGPEDVVKDALNAAKDGDCDRVVELSYFSKDGGQTRDEARQQCEDNSSDTSFDFKILGTEDHTGSLPSGVSDAAEVKVRFTVQFLGTKHSETTNVTVYKVGGKWLVTDDDAEGSNG